MRNSLCSPLESTPWPSWDANRQNATHRITLGSRNCVLTARVIGLIFRVDVVRIAGADA
jgi:hypothetical protein